MEVSKQFAVIGPEKNSHIYPLNCSYPAMKSVRMQLQCPKARLLKSSKRPVVWWNWPSERCLPSAKMQTCRSKKGAHGPSDKASTRVP